MENIERVKNRLPKGIFQCGITIGFITFLNIFILNMCSYLGCYNINFENVFRMNLLCNACTDISYQIQGHQFKIYFFLGGYILTKMNDIILQVVNTFPSNNSG